MFFQISKLQEKKRSETILANASVLRPSAWGHVSATTILKTKMGIQRRNAILMRSLGTCMSSWIRNQIRKKMKEIPRNKVVSRKSVCNTKGVLRIQTASEVIPLLLGCLLKEWHILQHMWLSCNIRAFVN